MKKFSFMSFLVVFFGICVAISCGSLLSTAFLSTGILTDSSINSEKTTVFAISTMQSENKDELLQETAFLQQNGGAGFVYKQNNLFYLLASVYANKADAELVKNNLLSQNTTCEILSITLADISVSGNFNANEKLVLNNCIKAKTNVFNKLYDVAISLDTGVFDIEKAKLECNKIYSETVTTKTNFETFFKNKAENDANLKGIYKTLQNNEISLSNLVSEKYESEGQTFSSLIKLAYCNVLLQ